MVHQDLDRACPTRTAIEQAMFRGRYGTDRDSDPDICRGADRDVRQRLSGCAGRQDPQIPASSRHQPGRVDGIAVQAASAPPLGGEEDRHQRLDWPLVPSCQVSCRGARTRHAHTSSGKWPRKLPNSAPEPLTQHLLALPLLALRRLPLNLLVTLLFGAVDGVRLSDAIQLHPSRSRVSLARRPSRLAAFCLRWPSCTCLPSGS